MSYAKLFSSITESSLWSEPTEVRILFVSMLAKADASGFVEAAIPGLARLSNLPQEQVESAIQTLESPDPHSKDLDVNPVNQGRRICKVPGGWMIINYEVYRDRRNDEERREWMRNYMRRYRKDLHDRKQDVNPVNYGKLPLAQAEAEAEAEVQAGTSIRTRTQSTTFAKPSIEEARFAAEKVGLPVFEADRFWNFYESKGWKVGKAPMRSWPHALAGWKSRWQERQSITPSKESLAVRKSRQELERINNEFGINRPKV